MPTVSSPTSVSVNWSSASNLHGDSAGEDINNLISASSSMNVQDITQNVTELELNFEQAHANKNSSGSTDVNDAQYDKLETDLNSFIGVANSAISGGSASPSAQSAYMTAIDAMVNDMRGEFLENASGASNSFSSFSGGTDGYKNISNSGTADMSALYDTPSQSALSEASTASVEPTAISGDSFVTPSSFSLYPSGSMPTADDVIQGSDNNDCYFDSVLAQLASTSSGASALAAGITQTSQDGQTPATFSVKMYGPDGKTVSIAVDDETMVGKDGTDSAGGANGQANWSTLYEKAFAKYVDMYPDALQNGASDSGYAMLNDLGTPQAAMMALQGVSSYSAEVDSGSTPLSDIDQLLQNGETVTTITNSTGSQITDTSGSSVSIDADHAYSVLGVDDTNKTITLRNPWGSTSSTGSAEFTISESQYAQLFGAYEYTHKNEPLGSGSASSASSDSGGTSSDSATSSTSSS